MSRTNAQSLCAVVQDLGGPDLTLTDVTRAKVGDDLLASIVKWETNPGRQAKADTIIPNGTEFEWSITSNYQRSRNERRREETALLQAEAGRLRVRLQHMKTVSQQMMQTRMQLEDAIQATVNVTEARQENLDELAIQVQSTLSEAVTIAHSLVDVTEVQPETIADYRSKVATATEARSRITAAFEQGMKSLESAQHALPSPEWLASEAARLSDALRMLHVKDTRDRVLDRAVEDQLQNFCEALENAQDSELTLDDILDDVFADEHDGTFTASLTGIDVSALIQRSWDLDQMALLNAREKLVDQARAALDNHVVPETIALQKELHSKVQANFEAEALVNALLEEMEDAIGDAVEASASMNEKGQEDLHDHDKSDSLKAVLKDLREYRPPDGPPLVLLDDADLDAEIVSVCERLAESRKAEHNWLADLPSLLPDIHHPLLSAVYANYPDHNAPPFSPPLEVKDLEDAARSHIKSMTESIVALQKDVGLNDRARRKLSTFIDTHISK
ncbi:hypothetical protein EIP91_002486 [Steccherinum ochraceum]|uniref:Uncharacterized protein n=1 Tax=Steccherinum ochraceum TaxID=92696 RepID=A0A4R0REK7_9APHY|nr:hypothetical protein EIP91_002486 [Steccherinum ochraceum]